MSMTSGQSSRIIENNAGKILVGGVIAGIAVHAIGLVMGEFGLWVFGDIMAVGSIVLAGLGYIGRWKDKVEGRQ